MAGFRKYNHWPIINYRSGKPSPIFQKRGAISTNQSSGPINNCQILGIINKPIGLFIRKYAYFRIIPNFRTTFWNFFQKTGISELSGFRGYEFNQSLIIGAEKPPRFFKNGERFPPIVPPVQSEMKLIINDPGALVYKIECLL